MSVAKESLSLLNEFLWCFLRKFTASGIVLTHSHESKNAIVTIRIISRKALKGKFRFRRGSHDFKSSQSSSSHGEQHDDWRGKQTKGLVRRLDRSNIVQKVRRWNNYCLIVLETRLLWLGSQSSGKNVGCSWLSLFNVISDCPSSVQGVRAI